MAAGQPPLRFRATIGARPIVLNYFTAQDNGGQANTLSVVERLPDGSSKQLLSRQRVPHGLDAGMHVVHRFHPHGGVGGKGGSAIIEQLNWPPIDATCLLQPEVLRPGQTVFLHGIGRIYVEAADSEHTRNWLEQRHLSRETELAPPSQSVQDAFIAAGNTAAGAMYGGSLGAAMVYREAKARQQWGETNNPEHDPLRRLSGVWAAVRPALRDQPAVVGTRLRLPEEAARHERHLSLGNRTAHLRARSVDGRRVFKLAFRLADRKLRVDELYGGVAGDAFARPQRLKARMGGHFCANEEHAPFYHRCVAPSAGSLLNSHMQFELHDFKIGCTLCLQGVNMRIVSCEPSTRALLSSRVDEFGIDRVSIGDDEEPWILHRPEDITLTALAAEEVKEADARYSAEDGKESDVLVAPANIHSGSQEPAADHQASTTDKNGAEVRRHQGAYTQQMIRARQANKESFGVPSAHPAPLLKSRQQTTGNRIFGTDETASAPRNGKRLSHRVQCPDTTARLFGVQASRDQAVPSTLASEYGVCVSHGTASPLEYVAEMSYL